MSVSDFRVPMVTGVPTRWKATSGGVLNLAAGGLLAVSGSDGKQTRVAVIITNMDAANLIYVCKLLGGNAAGVPLFPIYPQKTVQVLVSDDLAVLNPVANAATVNIMVCEQYPDTGNMHDNWPVFGVPTRQAGAPPAGGGGTPTGGGGGGTPTGGGGSSGGTGTQAGGGTYVR